MNAPPFEVADIVRAAGKASSRKTDPDRHGNIFACCELSSVVARPRSAATWISALAAASRPSPTTRVETAIAESARPTLVTDGSQSVKRDY